MGRSTSIWPHKMPLPFIFPPIYIPKSTQLAFNFENRQMAWAKQVTIIKQPVDNIEIPPQTT